TVRRRHGGEQSPYAVTLGDVVDLGQDAVQQVVIRWGDGSSDTFNAAHPLPADRRVVHQYDMAAGRVHVAVDVTDEDGRHLDVGDKDVTVLEVPAGATILAADTAGV